MQKEEGARNREKRGESGDGEPKRAMIYSLVVVGIQKNAKNILKSLIENPKI